MARVRTHEVIQYPLISEDAVTLIEKENKITFIVNRKAERTMSGGLLRSSTRLTWTL